MSTDSIKTPSKSNRTASKAVLVPRKSLGIGIFLARYGRAQRLAGQEADRLARRLDLHARATVRGHRSHVAGEDGVRQPRELALVGFIEEDVERGGANDAGGQGACKRGFVDQ